MSSANNCANKNTVTKFVIKIANDDDEGIDKIAKMVFKLSLYSILAQYLKE